MSSVQVDSTAVTANFIRKVAGVFHTHVSNEVAAGPPGSNNLQNRGCDVRLYVRQCPGGGLPAHAGVPLLGSTEGGLAQVTMVVI